MSIIKESKITAIEIQGDFKSISVRKLIIIKENNTVISESNWREAYDCTTNIDTLEPEVKEVAETVWTDEVKEAYREYMSQFAT